MERKEKYKNFCEAVIRTLYPPPSPEENKAELVDTSSHNLDLDRILDDESEGAASSSDGDECEDGGDGSKKLTRAQRKRLRKKKLKQAASQKRRIVIGPMLPASTTSCDVRVRGDAIANEPQGIRLNAAEGNDSVVSESGMLKEESKETASGTKGNKLKQRRMAKKMASDSRKLSTSENSHQEKKDP